MNMEEYIRMLKTHMVSCNLNLGDGGAFLKSRHILRDFASHLHDKPTADSFVEPAAVILHYFWGCLTLWWDIPVLFQSVEIRQSR